MNNRIINDITNFIFVEDKPQKVDAIFLPAAHTLSNLNMLPSFIARDMRSGLFRQVESVLNEIVGPVFAQRQIYTMATINPTVSSLEICLLKMECLLM